MQTWRHLDAASAVGCRRLPGGRFFRRPFLHRGIDRHSANDGTGIYQEAHGAIRLSAVPQHGRRTKQEFAMQSPNIDAASEIATEEYLANPVWIALTEAPPAFVERREGGARYRPEFAPFGAARNYTAQ